MREELMTKIKAEGVGAAHRWFEIAGSATAGNKAAKAECARLLGREVETMADYWEISSAAYALMTPGERTLSYAESAQALNAGKSIAGDADEYLANKLGQIRRERGMTQQQLAAKARVALSTLQKLESGKNRILGAQVDIVCKLAQALGVTVEELVSI